ncbi:MAG: SPOR domain-containing protein [Bacillati bacterium ANGP1]|uniref:SPOR domain-containing protein n=1 Tax=Candidatus Segetimicrobium genomatis TaxID=2569760 RepID=A0A537KP95_9BACT|nr:MAG: SPOR domain-containing protein [Terrabacteria group bacterium ANGP1]
MNDTTMRLQPVVAVLALVGLFAISVLVGYVGGQAFLTPSAPAPRPARPAPASPEPQAPAPAPGPPQAPATGPTTTPAKPGPETGVLYRVQVGAYISRENAEARAAKLREEGFDAYVTQSGTLYKVQVGAFAIRENAERLAGELKAAGYEVLIAP